MRIQHNINALNSLRQLGMNNTNTGKNLEKLSSGYRINRAGDDAAGLAISEKMRGQIRGLEMASKNAEDGISLIQTAEGGLNETHAILQRMRELAVQASNDTLQDTDRTSITTEVKELQNEIDRIATTTEFNKAKLLDGSFGVKLDTTNSTVAVGTDGVTNINISGAKAVTTYTFTVTDTEVALDDGSGNTQTIDAGAATYSGTLNFDKLGISVDLKNTTVASITTKKIITLDKADQNLQIGANAGQKLSITIDDMQANALGIDSTQISMDSFTNANDAITAIDSAITKVSNQRSTLGAYQNRLEHTISNLGVTSENLTAAESRIRDVDMAKEMMTYTKNNILTQAAQAMLAQANQQPQGVLQLLQ